MQVRTLITYADPETVVVSSFPLVARFTTSGCLAGVHRAADVHAYPQG